MTVPFPLLLNPPEVARVKCWGVECTKHLKLCESFTCLSPTNPASSMPACSSESARKSTFCLSDFINGLEYPAGKLLLHHLLSCRWRIGISWTWPFLGTLKFILEGTDPLLQCSRVNWLLLTGWFAVNSDAVDYHPPPKAVFATSQMFLIQGFEANPSYTLWIWVFLPT